MPIQNLKTIRQLAAARARSRVEWYMNTSSLIAKGVLEIDSDVSQPSKTLNDTENGMVATSMMGEIKPTARSQDITKTSIRCAITAKKPTQPQNT